MIVIVGAACQRVVENLVESASNELFAYDVGHLVFLVLLALYDETALQLSRYLHIIISIDAQDIFHHVAWTGHVNSICRHIDIDAFVVFGRDLHLERLADTLDSLWLDSLADESVYIVVVETYLCVFYGVRINVANLHGYLTASQLFAEDGCLFEGIDGGVWIYSTLETE